MYDLYSSAGDQIVVRGSATDMWNQVQRHDSVEGSVTSILNKVPRMVIDMESGTGIKGADKYCWGKKGVQLH